MEERDSIASWLCLPISLNPSWWIITGILSFFSSVFRPWIAAGGSLLSTEATIINDFEVCALRDGAKNVDSSMRREAMKVLFTCRLCPSKNRVCTTWRPLRPSGQVNNGWSSDGARPCVTMLPPKFCRSALMLITDGSLLGETNLLFLKGEDARRTIHARVRARAPATRRRDASFRRPPDCCCWDDFGILAAYLPSIMSY